MPNSSATPTARRFLAWAIGATSLLSPALAHAHFILVAPAAAMEQDGSGNPQKANPCGGTGTATGIVTQFRAGETITITVNERVSHPGHYRVALASTEEYLPAEPPITAIEGDECGMTVISEPTEEPVLDDGIIVADGLFVDLTPADGEQSVQVTLPPDVSCEQCVLQVIEYMSSHGAPCFYHHCANVSILPDNNTGGAGASGAGGDDGSGGSAPASGASGEGGSDGMVPGGGEGGEGGSDGTAPAAGAGGDAASGGSSEAGASTATTTGGSNGSGGSTSAAGASGAATSSGGSDQSGSSGDATASEDGREGDSAGCGCVFPRSDGGARSLAGLTGLLAFALGIGLRRRRRAALAGLQRSRAH